MNNAMLHDSLWRGRFYIRQHYRYMHPYDDKSGMSAFYVFTLFDLKTGFYKDVAIDGMNFEEPFNGYRLWQELNHFIVEDCDVWRCEDDVRADTTIYRKKGEVIDIEKIKLGTGR